MRKINSSMKGNIMNIYIKTITSNAHKARNTNTQASKDSNIMFNMTLDIDARWMNTRPSPRPQYS
jgi:hypothetical protein